jgi:ribosomal-protein-serine acetyltransferase
MDTNFLLTDGVILLRPPNSLDLPAIHTAVTESLADLQPWLDWVFEGYDEAAAQRWLENANLGWGHSSSYQFAIIECASGQFAGGCKVDGIDEKKRRCNLGYWVRSNRAGLGIASRAVRLAAAFAFQTVGMQLVEIVISAENKASQRAAQKAGAHNQGLLPIPLVVHSDLHEAVLYLLTPGDIGLHI